MDIKIKMDIKLITTKLLLELEESGSILSSGTIPNCISDDDPCNYWFEVMPLVDKELIIAWYNLCHAKLGLARVLDNLNQVFDN